MVPLLQQNLEARGIELLLNTTATEILMDNGTAVGVVAETADGAKVTVNAASVVITSGGFGANNEMIASIRPELDGFITTNAPGIQGQGIRMAQAVGADTVDLEQIQLHPTVHVQDTSAVLITEGLRGDGAILVNQEGERFFDEVSTRDKVSAAEFEQTGGYAWLIVDSRMSDASNVIQGYINKGYAETGETYATRAMPRRVRPTRHWPRPSAHRRMRLRRRWRSGTPVWKRRKTQTSAVCPLRILWTRRRIMRSRSSRVYTTPWAASRSTTGRRCLTPRAT